MPDDVVPVDAVVMVGFGRVWGTPSPSPFASKLETWLRLAEVPYRRKGLSGLPRSKSGKIPYIERPDGSVLADSSVIIETLTAERGVALDAALTQAQRDEDLLLQRLVEEHLYWTLVWTRWARPDGWTHVRRDYFRAVPAPIRPFIARSARNKALAQLHGHGIGRQDPERIVELARRDLAVLERRLGDRPYLHGDQPHGVDAILWAFLAGMASTPGECPLAAHLRSRPLLVAYVDRLRARVWSDLTA